MINILNFSLYQKMLAKDMSKKELIKEYKKSEQALKECAKKGDRRGLAFAMKRHGDFEYALLYQSTPEFQAEFKNRRK